MKQKLLLKSMLLLFALIAGSSSVWADEVTFAYGDYKGQGTSSSGSTYTMTKTDVSITNTKFYGNNSYAHFYAGGTTTITPASGVTITGIELTASSTSYNGYQSSGKVTASTGEVSGSTSSTTVTWAGSATSAFTISNDKQIRWTSIVVTYAKSGGSSVATPTFSAASGAVYYGTEITLTQNDATAIRYTTDGTTPDKTTGTVYSTPITITETVTIKAIAIKGEEVSDVATATYTIKVDAPTFNPETGSYLQGSTITLTSAGNTIYYNLTTNGSTPSDPSSSSGTEYTGPIVLSGGTTKIKAIAYDTHGNASSVVSRTYTTVTPVILPFSWAGGTTRATINSLTGVSQTGLDSDYSDDTYKLKFNGDNDNIIIFTDEKPVKVKIGVKMLGGSTTSKFSIQESTNGADFTEVEQLTISGSQNDVVNLETTKDFAATTRVIKLNFIKGSNVGVGPVSISCAPATLTPAKEYTTLTYVKALDFTNVTGLEAYIATAVAGASVQMTQVNKVPKGIGLVIKKTGSAASYDVPIFDGTGADNVTGNLMLGSATTTTYVDENAGYILSNGVFQPSSGGDLPAGKAYLNVAVSSAPVLNLSFDTTGIKVIDNGQLTIDNYYNLAGQRVAQPTKGLYIVNGKKVIIK